MHRVIDSINIKAFFLTLFALVAPLVVAAETLPISGLGQDFNRVMDIQVHIQFSDPAQHFSWTMPRTVRPIFLEKLASLPRDPAQNEVFPGYKKPTYQGVRVEMNTYDGHRYPPIQAFSGQVMAGGQMLGFDPERTLEYWLLGTVQTVGDQRAIYDFMPVYTFKQCTVLQFELVRTKPRQCLLPDGVVILEIEDYQIRAPEVAITDFDGCLLNGIRILSMFPRRCQMNDGRVFIEPTREVKKFDPSNLEDFDWESVQ